jgi:hypothetical protein
LPAKFLRIFSLLQLYIPIRHIQEVLPDFMLLVAEHE